MNLTDKITNVNQLREALNFEGVHESINFRRCESAYGELDEVNFWAFREIMRLADRASDRPQVPDDALPDVHSYLSVFREEPGIPFTAIDHERLMFPIVSTLPTGEKGISYFPTPEHAKKDRRIVTKCGRFYAKLGISNERVKELVAKFDSHYKPRKLFFATTEEDIERVYREGPNSCMGDKEWYIHPCRVYESPDLAVAYITEENSPKGRITGRAVVRLDSNKGFVRIYGDEDRTYKALEAEGLSKAVSLLHTRLKRIPIEQIEGDPNTTVAMPYLDGGHQKVALENVEDPYLTVVDSDNVPDGAAMVFTASETSGFAYLRDTERCDHNGKFYFRHNIYDLNRRSVNRETAISWLIADDYEEVYSLDEGYPITFLWSDALIRNMLDADRLIESDGVFYVNDSDVFEHYGLVSVNGEILTRDDPRIIECAHTGRLILKENALTLKGKYYAVLPPEEVQKLRIHRKTGALYYRVPKQQADNCRMLGPFLQHWIRQFGDPALESEVSTFPGFKHFPVNKRKALADTATMFHVAGYVRYA